MDFLNCTCKALLDQIGKRKFRDGDFVCHYFGDNPSSICEGISEDYFTQICNTLCLICYKENCSKIEYDESLCKKYIGFPKKLIFDISNSYSNMFGSGNEEGESVLPWTNQHLSFYLDYCESLEFFGYDDSTKKELLSFYAILFYKCENEELKSKNWYSNLNTIRDEVLNIQPVLNAQNVKISFFTICENEKNNSSNDIKPLLQAFVNAVTHVFKRDNDAFLIKNIYRKSIHK